MMFNRLRSKLKYFYALFIAPPKIWRLPNKSDILIYDADGAAVLMSYLTGYSVEIIALRGESVNVPCLLRAMLKLSFWKGKPIEPYTDAFIQAVSPKVVITFIDNNSKFYSISNHFPDVRTIFVQNGVRNEMGSVFGTLVQPDKYHVDYMLVHGSQIGKHYQKYISGISIVVGSLKNNSVKVSADVVDGSILFISQYRPEPKNNAPFFITPDGTPVYFDQFYASETRALNFLSKWCVENNKRLQICGVSTHKECAEFDFYSARLTGCLWEFIPRVDIYSSYKLIDAAEIVVFIDSTLGSEALSRGKKVAGFSCRMAIPNKKTTKFGWPADIPDNGPFWTSDADEKQFQRVMDYLNTVSDEEWEQTRQFYANEIMEFDAGNTRFVSLLSQLLPRSEISNHDK